jgi:hypothetical protein
MSALKPSYSHQFAMVPPKTRLTLDSPELEKIYQKLKNFLAIQIHPSSPAMGWNTLLKSRDLFAPNGFHYKVR